MNKKNILQRLRARLSGGKQPTHTDTNAKQNAETMLKLLQMVDATEEVELACDDVFELLDEYVELALSGGDPAEVLPLVHKHLERCRDCGEEYEALTRILESSSDLNLSNPDNE